MLRSFLARFSNGTLFPLDLERVLIVVLLTAAFSFSFGLSPPSISLIFGIVITTASTASSQEEFFVVMANAG